MMKKLSRLLLSFIFVCCCIIGITACGSAEEKFPAPTGFQFDETTLTVTFDRVDGAESYDAKVAAVGGSIVYENKALKETKIELADKNLVDGEYAVSVAVNATEEKGASDMASFKFTIIKTALAAPAGLEKNGDNVTWTAVDGATNGYSVRIYNKETKDEVQPPVTVSVASFSTAAINEIVNVQTETTTYVIEVKALATDENGESAVAVVDWVVKGKILKPELSVETSENGTSVSWDRDERATNGYTAELYSESELVKTYDIPAGTAAVEIDRTDAAKGQTFTLKIYGIATDDLRQGDVAEIEFTQSLPALASVENLVINANMTASWSKVAGASEGYTVTVYRKGNEANVKLESLIVEQSEAPSVDLSDLEYAAEREYTVKVVANAVENEYLVSEAEIADFISSSKWIFADEEDKAWFTSDGPTIALENGKLMFTDASQGRNVVKFNRNFNVGDKIIIDVATEYLYIYGLNNGNGAETYEFELNNRIEAELSVANGGTAKTFELTVLKAVKGLYFMMDGSGNKPVTLNSLEVKSADLAFATESGRGIYAKAGAGATVTEDGGKLLMSRTADSDNNVTLFYPVIKAGSFIELNFGKVTATSTDQDKFFVYGINQNGDTLLLNGNSVLRRDGFTDNADNETRISENQTIVYVADADIYGVRFGFGAIGTTVEIKSIKICEAKTVYDFSDIDDIKYFTADYRAAGDAQMTIGVVDDGNTKALNIKSIDGSNFLRFAQPLKAGTKIIIDIKTQKCHAYGISAGTYKDTRVDSTAIAEIDLTGDGTRHTVEITVNADTMGIILMFGNEANTDTDGSFIYGITIINA